MSIFICGAFTNGQYKPCKTCKRYMLWGISTGHCTKHNTDTQTSNHCKYYKRDSRVFNKNGEFKSKELEEGYYY